MAKRESAYNCILYEPGDKVVEKYGDDKIREIEAVRFSTVGVFTIQILKFKDEPESSGDFSNLFLPIGETELKYQNGFKFLEEVKVKSPTTTFRKPKQVREPKDKDGKVILTEEDIRPKYVSANFFNRNPIIKKDE